MPGVAVPSDASVVLVRAGDRGDGDYSYAWGSGPVDAATGRFTVTLTQATPDLPILAVDKAGTRAGVALAVRVRAAEVRAGPVRGGDVAADRIPGAAWQHAVIDVQGTLTKPACTAASLAAIHAQPENSARYRKPVRGRSLHGAGGAHGRRRMAARLAAFPLRPRSLQRVRQTTRIHPGRCYSLVSSPVRPAAPAQRRR